jgi:hypothetical protein
MYALYYYVRYEASTVNREDGMTRVQQITVFRNIQEFRIIKGHVLFAWNVITYCRTFTHTCLCHWRTPSLLQSRKCEDSKRCVLLAARTIVCSRQSRVVLDNGTGQGTSCQNAAQSEDGQRNKYCATHKLNITSLPIPWAKQALCTNGTKMWRQWRVQYLWHF